MPGTRLLLGGLMLSLVLGPGASPGAAQGAPAAAPEEESFEPKIGATFNAPTTRQARRAILSQVVRSINHTPPGEQIRVATWNFDDDQSLEALLAARDRGVKVQVVVSDRVSNPNWATLRRELNQDDSPDTFAVQCAGACRSRTRIMHSKFYMFSLVGTTPHVTMISSSNLTVFAGNRQWNDLLTTKSAKVYDFLAPVFDEYARDRAVAEPFQAQTFGDYRIWVYPLGDRNPQLSQLRKVRCHGATGGTGTRDGRTRIRVSVAGWFDVYGEDIAKELRRLSDRGCDVKAVVTLAGRGINRAFKAPGGRGPIPIRRLAWDGNGDGVPDRYLHQKSMAISGVFEDDTSASVILTGTPNWSARAANSDEVLVRLVDRPKMTRQYLARVDNLFSSPFSSSRLMTRADLRRALVRYARVAGQPRPEWLELD